MNQVQAHHPHGEQKRAHDRPEPVEQRRNVFGAFNVQSLSLLLSHFVQLTTDGSAAPATWFWGQHCNQEPRLEEADINDEQMRALMV